MGGLTKGVGARIRLYRKKKRLSLTDLSRLTGIAASNLSSIELSKTSPTLNTLIKIADAFEMQVGAFLDEMLYGTAVFCPAVAARHKADQAEGVSIAALTDHVQKSGLSVKTVTAESDAPSFPLDSQTDSFVYCLQGTADIVVHGTVHFLHPGDGIYIRAYAEATCTPTGEDELRLLTISNL